MKTDYLESIKKQLETYKKLGEKAMDQVPDDKLFWQYNDDSNSIATIVKHMWGNMMSRWTDFLTTDGEKEWRNREAEFDNDLKTRKDVMVKWNEGWDCTFKAINGLQDSDLGREISIRNQGLSVIDAINRQLAHYSYHIGQIVFIGRMICGAKWSSLSIPRGKSKEYNAEMFSKPKRT